MTKKKPKNPPIDIRKMGWKQVQWLLTFMFPALIFIVFTAYFLLAKTPMTFSVAMPITVAFGGLSFAGFIYTLRKPPKFRLMIMGALAGLVLLTSLTLMIVFNEVQKTLTTCEVCGYASLSTLEAPCPVCFISLTDAFRIESEYESREEMIKVEQIMFFMPEPGNNEIDFFAPEISPEGFAKDKTWQPTTTIIEVLEVQEILPDSLK